MENQADFFEHSLNTRLVELRRKIQAREEEIKLLRDEVKEVSSNLRGATISEDRKTRLIVGPNRRAFIVSEDGGEARTFLPISLDLLAQAVQELYRLGVQSFDGKASNAIDPFRS